MYYCDLPKLFRISPTVDRYFDRSRVSSIDGSLLISLVLSLADLLATCILLLASLMALLLILLLTLYPLHVHYNKRE